MPINTFREHYIFITLELLHLDGRFTIGKGGGGISKAGVRVSE